MDPHYHANTNLSFDAVWTRARIFQALAPFFYEANSNDFLALYSMHTAPNLPFGSENSTLVKTWISFNQFWKKILNWKWDLFKSKNWIIGQKLDFWVSENVPHEIENDSKLSKTFEPNHKMSTTMTCKSCKSKLEEQKSLFLLQ